MSIYTKQELIESFPAYDVFEREADRDGHVNITAKDTLGLKSNKGFYWTYSPGSVVSYALDYNEDPIEAIQDAKSRGHQLHWINQNSTVLSSHARAKEKLVAVHIGMLVRFEGLIATIEKDHNNNLKFVEYRLKQ